MAIIVAIIFGVVGIQYIRSSNAATTRPQAGVQFHCMWTSYDNATRVKALDKLDAAGVEWVRIDYGWAGVEANGPVAKLDPATQWYTKQMDFCVSEANKRGIKVLASLWQTPKWASGATNSTRSAELVRPANPNTYAAYAKKAASYYNGSKPNLKVHAWEVWNEPDPHQKFWTNLDGSHGGTDKYAEMLKLAYPQFKAGDPAAKVLLGGPTYQEYEWLEEIYGYGAKNSFDIVATHPYQGRGDAPPEQASDGKVWWFTSFPKVLEVMRANGDGNKEVWFTEFGWSTHANTSTTPEWSRGVTEAQQADYIVRAFKYAHANWPNVTNMFIYNERAKNTSSDHQNGYGIMRADLSNKPAYIALKNYLTAPQSSTPTPAPVDKPALSTPKPPAKDTTKPTVSIASPQNGAKVSKTMTVKVTAKDNVGLKHTSLYIDNVYYKSDNKSPYEFQVPTEKYSNGTKHTLHVSATDTAGNRSETPKVTVTVNNIVKDTTKPTVSITSPQNGAKVSGTMTVKVNAKDNVGMQRTSLYIDGVYFKSDDSSPYEFQVPTEKYGNGTKHTLHVSATDTSGNRVETSKMTVTVDNSVQWYRPWTWFWSR